ncbi:hypothetical protein CMO88_01205 [Candidatus Woesearchaeota archaeon]|nr:hypothetical protein [Candidatus Woesearchaeota archaeon]|tara:strand:- start:1472 stop:2593 length:1122 start_codon:yes stop_codon:yes gene_type:complete
MEKNFFGAIATLVGTTIGAGVLGIPFVVAQAGSFIGVGHIIIIGVAIILLNLYLGEVVLRTKDKHQLTGYAERYLGNNGKRVMAFSMVLLNYGALTAYIIGVGIALSSITALSTFTSSILFFIIAAAIVYFGLKAVEESEMVLTFFVIAIVAVITFIAFFSGSFEPVNLSSFDLSKIAIPYGVVLFAFAGALAIPEMSQELGKNKKLLKKAIIIGGIIPLTIYALFALAVVGITGADTSQVATIKLGEVLGPQVLLAANLFAIFAMATSFLAIGLALKQMYNFDYNINKNISWGLAVIIPIAAFLIGIKEFIPVLAIAGGVAGGLQGIMIVLMHHNAKKLGQRKPEFSIGDNKIISILLVLMFVAGMAYEIIL